MRNHPTRHSAEIIKLPSAERVEFSILFKHENREFLKNFRPQHMYMRGNDRLLLKSFLSKTKPLDLHDFGKHIRKNGIDTAHDKNCSFGQVSMDDYTFDWFIVCLDSNNTIIEDPIMQRSKAVVRKLKLELSIPAYVHQICENS